mgnify:CR=1 FL=1
MRIAVYGGSFNPPHPAHVRAARLAYEALQPDKLLIIPAADPPHKQLAEGSPDPQERFELTRIAFRGFPEAEVSDMELVRGGESYTSDTVAELAAEYPGAEIFFVIGTDMLTSFERWHNFRDILALSALAVLPRDEGDMPEIERCSRRFEELYGARIRVIDVAPLPMSSSEMRELLVSRRGADVLDGEVYARIIRVRDYGAKPQLDWLRERAYKFLKPTRVPHVAGCEHEAVKLAARWGADQGDAAEAAILHDITKKLTMPEQLKLAEKYGIVFDALECENIKLTHAITGAALSKDLFGVTGDVYDAIRWHTTGKPDMTLLEKVIYLADYIEPTRDFEGVEPLRALAYEDIDAAMALGLEMSLEELQAGGIVPHSATVEALRWYGKDKT